MTEEIKALLDKAKESIAAAKLLLSEVRVKSNEKHSSLGYTINFPIYYSLLIDCESMSFLSQIRIAGLE